MCIFSIEHPSHKLGTSISRYHHSSTYQFHCYLLQKGRYSLRASFTQNSFSFIRRLICSQVERVPVKSQVWKLNFQNLPVPWDVFSETYTITAKQAPYYREGLPKRRILCTSSHVPRPPGGQGESEGGSLNHLPLCRAHVYPFACQFRAKLISKLLMLRALRLYFACVCVCTIYNRVVYQLFQKELWRSFELNCTY